MMIAQTQKEILSKVEKLLQTKIVDTRIPPQGMGGEVFNVVNEKGNEYAIKYSTRAINDVLALNLIKENKLDIPVPKLFGSFPFEDKTILILEKINFPLLESICNDNKPKYIESMISNLKKIHTIKSNTAGLLNSKDKTISWKELLLFKYSGKHEWFNWEEIIHRDGVDTNLMQNSIQKIIKRIEGQTFIDHSYPFLHTDFNQRNLFVDQSTFKIASIIDWTEAMFGDPLYDFARVRMYIWHFNLQHSTLEHYYKLLNLSEEEKKLEDLYLVSQIIDYITWYSETKNDFNNGRLRLHQQFLREYKW